MASSACDGCELCTSRRYMSTTRLSGTLPAEWGAMQNLDLL